MISLLVYDNTSREVHTLLKNTKNLAATNQPGYVRVFLVKECGRSWTFAVQSWMILDCLESRKHHETSWYILVLGCKLTRFLVDLCSKINQESLCGGMSLELLLLCFQRGVRLEDSCSSFWRKPPCIKTQRVYFRLACIKKSSFLLQQHVCLTEPMLPLFRLPPAIFFHCCAAALPCAALRVAWCYEAIQSCREVRDTLVLTLCATWRELVALYGAGTM